MRADVTRRGAAADVCAGAGLVLAGSTPRARPLAASVGVLRFVGRRADAAVSVRARATKPGVAWRVRVGVVGVMRVVRMVSMRRVRVVGMV